MENQMVCRSFPIRMIAVLIIIPTLLFAILRFFPQIDPVWNSGIGHFYIVTFTSLVAAVSASFMYLVIGRQSVEAQFLTLSFMAMAGIFLVHGFSTPGIVLGPNLAVGLAARLSLTIGSIFMVCAVWDYRPEQAMFLRQHAYLIAFITLLLLGLFVWLMYAAPPFIELLASSELSAVIAVITISFLLFSMYRAWRKYQQQPKRLYIVLVIALAWLILAQISQYEAPIWAFSWWLYHIAMLSAYLLTMFFLVSSYEKTQEFGLTRYFVSLGLLLGLPMAFLLGEFSVTLSEREDIRWILIGVFILSVVMLILAMFTLVYRAQQILNRRREMVEQEKQWRKDMTDLIAHDLMSPLNSIILDLNLLQRQESIRSNTGVLDRVKRIQDSSETMSSLVYDMLNVERIESGSLELQKKQLDFSDLVKASLTRIKSVAEYRDIIVSANLPQDALMLALDEKIIQRVLQNLLANALKFAPQGGKIRLEAVNEGQQLRFSISDNGPGIPKDQREQIFEKFGQTRDSEQEQVYGLGLAFCKLVIEEHGGTIHVEDNPGGGSKFVFTLPL